MAITAWSHGIGSCILGSINKKTLSEAVKIPDLALWDMHLEGWTRHGGHYEVLDKEVYTCEKIWGCSIRRISSMCMEVWGSM